MLDAQFVARRKRPLIVAGPTGITDAFARTMEAAFAGFLTAKHAFEIKLMELEPNRDHALNDLTACAITVCHGEPPSAYYGYRLNLEGKTIACSGEPQVRADSEGPQLHRTNSFVRPGEKSRR